MTQKIIGLTGKMASGKGTVAKRLMKKYGASKYRFSDVLREVLDTLDVEITRTNMQDLSTMIRKRFGEDVLARGVYRKVIGDSHGLIVVDGIRRKQDFKMLKKLPGFRLVYVTAPLEERYKRISQRTENSDDNGKTLEDFKKEQTGEPEMEIANLRKEAYVIENNGTLEDLENKIDALIEGQKPKKA